MRPETSDFDHPRPEGRGTFCFRWTGRGSSLTSKSVDDLVSFDPSVKPLLDQRDAIVAFFDKVGLVS